LGAARNGRGSFPAESGYKGTTAVSGSSSPGLCHTSVLIVSQISFSPSGRFSILIPALLLLLLLLMQLSRRIRWNAVRWWGPDVSTTDAVYYCRPSSRRCRYTGQL